MPDPGTHHGMLAAATEPGWLYLDGTHNRGPVTSRELVSLIASGRLARDTLVWTEGRPSWTPALSVPELSGSLPPPIPVEAIRAARERRWTFRETLRVLVAFSIATVFELSRSFSAEGFGGAIGLMLIPIIAGLALDGRKGRWRGFSQWVLWGTVLFLLIEIFTGPK